MKKQVKVNRCQNPQCNKPATLKCPTCIKKKLPNSYFCGKECFQAFWPIHKLYHKKKLQELMEEKNFKGPLKPGKITPRVPVSDKIAKPDYAETGVPVGEEMEVESHEITVNSEEVLQRLREAGKLARRALDLGHSMVAPGVTTDAINNAVHDFIIENGAYPSPLNYCGFPKSICTSVNEVICHGIPDSRPLQDGDIVNLDITVYYKGVHADLNETYGVGKIDADSLYLIEKSYRCMEEAIKIVKPDVLFREVGNVIGRVAKEAGLSVVRSFCGHGIGEHFHTNPNVAHYSRNKTPGIMRAGNVFTIEPMIN